MTPPTALRPGLITHNMASLPWAPWAMRGAWFKLLHADLHTGKFTLLIRLEPGASAPAHSHVGAVEGIVLEGSFYYSDAPEVRYGPGAYLFEPAGAVHHPISPEGAIMFGVFHGPVEGVDEAGGLTGRIDAQWHVRNWQEFLSYDRAQPASHK